jgi:hypothetical protein
LFFCSSFRVVKCLVSLLLLHRRHLLLPLLLHRRHLLLPPPSPPLVLERFQNDDDTRAVKLQTVVRNMAISIHDVCLELVSSRSKPKKVKREEGLSDIVSDFALLCYLARYALYSPPLCLRQRLPELGQLAFPSTLLRRFLRGGVVATAHGLVTAPASVFVTARKKKIWMNRVFARVMSGFVVLPLQAAATDRIEFNPEVNAAAASGDVADVLSYLIADANCVNKRDG